MTQSDTGTDTEPDTGAGSGAHTGTAGGSAPVVEAHAARIPALGFGTWQLEGRNATAMTREALELGYRHVDTAQAYGNEAEVGRGLARSTVPRDEVFLTTKVWPDRYAPGDFQASVDESLEKLGVDRVDLLLLHWPSFQGTTLERTLGLLNEAREAGKTRHIGVSNFTTSLLDRAWTATDAPLVTNQVEYHPYLDQDAVLAATRERGMCLTAYSPLARGQVLDDPTLREIADRHGSGPAAVTLRWLIEHEGVAAIPKTSDPDHARSNLGALEVELSEEEMEAISGLARPDGRIITPGGLAPDWD
jgi:diketogulonate reductase-like aldo/keto reductase